MEHIKDVLSGAAPLAQSDVDMFYEKFNIDSNSLKFRQGGWSQNRSAAERKIHDST